jgi:hypothetical protein
MHVPNPRKAGIISHHTIFVQFMQLQHACLLYSSFCQQKRFSSSTPTRTTLELPKTNLPSFLKQSRTRFRRVHWLTRSSPAGPAPQMKQGVTTIALSFFFVKNTITLSIGLYIDCTQIQYVTLARSCLVLSYRLHRENAETMREAT